MGRCNGKNIVYCALLQIMADIFNTNVYTLTETDNSASLGAAYCAKCAVSGGSGTFQEAVRDAPSYKLANTPRQGTKEIYQSLIARYAELEKSVTTDSI